MIVVDTNLIAYLHLPSEHTATAERVFRRDPDWAAPFLWRSEFRSVVLGTFRRGLLEVDDAKSIVASAESLMRGREFLTASDAVLELALSSKSSAYDCEFVALAAELDVPLVTNDRALRKAFPERVMSPEGFLGAA